MNFRPRPKCRFETRLYGLHSVSSRPLRFDTAEIDPCLTF
jgi:hypothetical protein